MKTVEAEQTRKAEIRKAEFLAAGKVCQAIFRPRPVLTREPLMAPDFHQKGL